MRKRTNITIRRLEVFVTIAEAGGFTAAAETLGMAQPSVSSHVQALEAQAGGPLFERRRGRGVDLTELGKTFLRHARQLLEEANSLALDLDRSRAETDRRVVFACQRSLSNFVLPSTLAEFARQHETIELITRVGVQEEVIKQVQDGVANLGCYLSNQEVPGLKSIVVGRQQLVIVAAPNHPLTRHSSIEPAELSEHDFVGPPENSLFGQALRQLLAGIGAQNIRVVSKATEFQFLRALVEAGVGLSCSLLRSVEADVAKGSLVRLPVNAPPLVMEVRQIFSLKRPLSPSVATFAEFLRKHYEVEQSLARPAAALQATG